MQKNFKKLFSCFLATLMIVFSICGSKKIINDGSSEIYSPQAIIAVIASGGSFAAVVDGAVGTFMASMGVDAAELAPIFEAAAAGATQAELIAMFGTFFGWAVMVAAGAAIIA